MTNPMIPAQAVEAAKKRIGEAVTYRDIRTILEAAAPHMLATNKPVKEVSTGTLIRKLLDESRTDG